MKMPSKWDSARLFAGHKSKNTLKAFMPGHVLNRPGHWRAGVIFTSPHSGHIYPEGFVKATELDLKQLRRNEDIFIDEVTSNPC